MVRVKRGTTAHKRRKNVLKHAKGFKWGRKSKYKAAKEALMHAWSYAYRDRRRKKRDFRKLWQIKINSACRQHGMSYSKFIAGLKKCKIEIDRKILANLVQNHPQIFEKIATKARETKPKNC
ncbi:MAG: 50S ribosomal protein L20 [Candidatus Nealsonbacteria bacterium]|nr:50S ribosomal protein L20 [Candidatus Nealsonbacteria bacterium]